MTYHLRSYIGHQDTSDCIYSILYSFFTTCNSNVWTGSTSCHNLLASSSYILWSNPRSWWGSSGLLDITRGRQISWAWEIRLAVFRAPVGVYTWQFYYQYALESMQELAFGAFCDTLLIPFFLREIPVLIIFIVLTFIVSCQWIFFRFSNVLRSLTRTCTLI